MVVFQCGHCGLAFSVSDDHVRDKGCVHCPCCSEASPKKINDLAFRLVSYTRDLDTDGWQLLFVPGEPLTAEEILASRVKDLL